MKLKDRKLLFFTFFIALAVSACTTAPPATTVNTDASGSALKGYDAVAYFTVNNAVKGDPRYEYVWNGAKWYFSSEENMTKFRERPEDFAPQFGGYCSYAVSEGYTADGDPEAWKVVEGKLYLNYNRSVKQKWEQNQTERIEKGKKNWDGFKRKKPEHKG
jgi:YHS domain-containing protein